MIMNNNKNCPTCDGSIEVKRGELDSDGNVTRRAEVWVIHRRSCEQWHRVARAHGCHPDVHTLIHEGDEVKITEGAR
jgi:hypothetical protein